MFGFGNKNTANAAAPKRGNLKFECFFWTLITFVVVIALLAGSDLLAKYWFDAANAQKECFVSFSYSFLAIVVTAKLNETMNLHSFNLRYGDDKMLAAVRAIAGVGNRWKALRQTGCRQGSSPCDIPPQASPRSESQNDNKRIEITNYSVFVSANDRQKPWTQEEDKARRIVKNYFSSALELYRCGGISRKTLRVICDTDAITLFFNVIEVMEYIVLEDL